MAAAGAPPEGAQPPDTLMQEVLWPGLVFNQLSCWFLLFWRGGVVRRVGLGRVRMGGVLVIGNIP